MRAGLVGMISQGGLQAAGGVALAIGWVYAVDRGEAFIGISFLVVGVVALGWSRWLRRRRDESGSDSAT